MGVFLFLASISTLIGAALVGYVIVRLNAETWPPPGVPGAPSGLWISTVLIALASLSVHRAAAGASRGDRKTLLSGLGLTLFLVVAFVAAQAWSGREVLAAVAGREVKDLFTFTFFMLVSLHAVHVVGGLIPLLLVIGKARKGTADSEGVRLLGIYFHYLGVVWLVMFVLLSL
jgi:heme/copper-type cytochrome/quinol oxidase subunit 3